MSLDIAGCIVAIKDGDGRPQACRQEPTHAGLTGGNRYPHEVWVVFACERHAAELIAARPMLDRDRTLLENRRKQRNGRTTPIASGAEARRLLIRARAWADNHRPPS